MKYTKNDLLEFGRFVRKYKINDINDLFILFQTEKSTTKRKYPLNTIAEKTCDYYGISEQFFYSQLKFGNLPVTRLQFVNLAFQYGFESLDIENYMSWSQPRVSALKHKGLVKRNQEKSFTDAEIEIKYSIENEGKT